MIITEPTTYAPGTPGTVTILDVDFRTRQEIPVFGVHLRRPIMITSIAVMSKQIAAHSAGATFTAREADTTAPIAATTTITSNATAPVDGATVAVGDTVYTFKTTLTDSTTANQVKINGSAANALINLKAAINGTGTPGTDYGSLTIPNQQATAGAITATTLVLTATPGYAGNLLSVATTGTPNLTSYPAFSGGSEGTTIHTLVTAAALANTDAVNLYQFASLAATKQVIAPGNDLVVGITAGGTATTNIKDIIISYLFLDR